MALEVEDVMSSVTAAKDDGTFFIAQAYHCAVGTKPGRTVSRTIGSDQLVDEMVITFTHDVEMDWMLPGIPPTGRRVEVALVVIVRFRDGKLAHEHIYWDQASVLVQIGLLDPEKLPVAGVDSARKVLDPALPANMRIRSGGR